ncbi:MAG: hypothetical protein KDN19_22260, partial [Verrucomicrobiae bacterium]|nr:hypothetical protein [Verrucomicrobiae bacterium]
MKRLSSILSLFAAVSLGCAAAAEKPLDYHADIAPLLRQYCAGCHNDDDFEGDFSVERYADIEEGGSHVMLRPGKPEDSYLVKVMTGDVSEPMPPKDEPQPSEEEVSQFTRWIREGAKGPADDI